MTFEEAISELETIKRVYANMRKEYKPCVEALQMAIDLLRQADTPQTDCYVSDLCKHYGDKQICGRCRNRNLFCEAEPQPRCPKCGKRGYIRSLESMGVKLNVFYEYKWKCINCNNYFKEEPKDEPQTEDDYFLSLMDAVKRGEMSDASANQAWYEYINKQAEESDTPQTDSDTNCTE